MRIAVLAGGASAERDVSLLSGEMICAALRRSGFETAFVDSYLGVDVAPGEIDSLYTTEAPSLGYRVTENLPDLAALATARGDVQGEIGPNVVEILRQADIVYNALHGGDGENGRLQSFLDVLSIPYTGDGYLPSALAMHKPTAKLLFSQAGVPVPNGQLLKRGEKADSWRGSFPCIVKPAASGSSVGVRKVDDILALAKALDETFLFDEEALVEEFIVGREFAVGVLGGNALPVIEMLPNAGIYDYAHKYQSGLTEETCPAQIPAEVAEKMQRLAEKACSALGIEVVARGEFILTDDGDIYCLEMNTLPGMTPISLLPQEAAAAGLDYDALCRKVIELSFRRYEH